MYKGLDARVRERAAEMMASGMTVSATARVLGVTRHTIRRWVNSDIVMQRMLIDGRLRASDEILAYRAELKRIAFDTDEPPHARVRALLELARAIDPVSFDATFRRRVAEAEDPEMFNSSIQRQKWLDERDARLQEENAKKAMEAEASEEEDQEGELSLIDLTNELRQIQHQAGLEVAKEADNYEEPPKPNGKANGSHES